ncbi:hypothetical protein KW538_11025 [Vibrio fluvialis]|nr:hypothetical protein [Vibrio fluvialis]
METISSELVDIALERVEGFAFEKFAQSFFSVIDGRDFVPCGGVKDGGADGVFRTERETTYYQMTRQENHRSKIRQTVGRLREFNRNVNSLIYVTARSIPHIDKEEDDLGEELGIRLRIRDRRYISSHINDSAGTISAFYEYLEPYTRFLLNVQTQGDRFITSPHVKDPSAFVFLQHELSQRQGDKKMIHSLADTMILWALSETDPDNDILMTEQQIKERIFGYFPWVQKVLQMHIKPRLEHLKGSTKDERKIRWYSKAKSYCLPHETRKAIASEATRDETLRIRVHDELKLVASGLCDADDGFYDILANGCIEVINKIFERQGLLFSHFISAKPDAEPPLVVSDCIDESIKSYSFSDDNQVNLYRETLDVLMREVFYNSTLSVREYLKNLSKTYVLLFSLQAEPKVVEYFSNMSVNFRLFLGSDILVKAISERYLNEENQAARNLLKIASEAGVKLYLSECVLQEVYTHLKGTFWEFHNHFREMEQYMKPEIIRNCDKILIRSYFYARAENKVKSWKKYIEQFVTYERMEKDEGIDDIRRYLVSEYRLKFVPNSDLESVCNKEMVKSLANRLIEEGIKEHESLAYNTALQIHGVYGERRKHGEVSGVSELGYKTWWMTNQTRVLKITNEIVSSNGSEYTMRPEFLLNFIALSPNCQKVKNSFQNIFPTIFGIQLGHRLKKEHFHQVLDRVNDWKDFEPGRVTALMSQMCDELKSDRFKKYENEL